MTAALRATDLVKRYPGADRNAVDGLTFAVEPGSITGLLGPNGSGKTTLTKLTCGVTAPTSGDISVFGMVPSADGGRAKHEIAVVHQSATFDMMLSGTDNLKIAAAFKGVRWRAAWPEVERLVELFGLTGRMSQLVFTLSGGEFRRLQVIRALMGRSRLLLLDEPSAGLDVAGRREVWSLINGLREEHGTTVIWTSHYVEELERNCDQVLIINHGRQLEFAAPSVLTEKFGHHTAVLRPGQPSDIGQLASRAESAGLKAERLKDRVEVSGTGVREQVPGMLADLNAAGIEMAAVEFRTPSLEDAFVQLITESG